MPAASALRAEKVIAERNRGAHPCVAQHIVALLAVGTRSTMAQTGVSGPVVVDGESFLDALFACACRG